MDYVNQLEERSRSELRKRRIGEFTRKLADTYYGEEPQRNPPPAAASNLPM